ncbi:MAG: SufD family Fe-S cluster assembly protein [Bacilli bacterium]|nr:SufD family Fe-S cluster assembly protein [Bacilli bacterium]
MTKYTLNETPVRTSINFAINDISLDLDIPSYKESTYTITNKEEVSIKETNKKDFKSRIGLDFDNYKEIKIDITKSLTKPLVIEYDVDNLQVINTIINISKDIEAKVIIKYKGTGFNSSKINTNLEEYSKLKLDVINLINDESTSFISTENEIAEKAYLDYNFIDLGGKTRLSNYYSNINGYEAKNDFKNIYLGTNEDIIDMNYYAVINAPKAEANIRVEGAIDDKAKKSFKGTIDFISGSKESIGEENENCIILSDKAISKSLPMLLCNEESVIGSHGVSSGKIDHNKLFYLMSRGLSEQEAKKLIINANFNSIINNLIDDSIKEEILKIIDKKID